MTQSLRDQFLASPSEDEAHADQGTSLRDQFLSAQAPTRPLLTRPTPQPPSGIVRRVVGDTAVSLGSGIIDVGEGLVGLSDLATMGVTGRGLQAIGYDPAKTKEMIEDWYSPEQKQANQNLQQAKGFVGTLEAAAHNPSAIVQGAFRSVPSMLPFLTGQGEATAVARAPGLIRGLINRPIPFSARTAGAINEGLMQAGQSAEQNRARNADGLLTPEQAIASVGSGIGDALLSRGGSAVAGKFGIETPESIIAGGRRVAQPTTLLGRNFTGIPARAINAGKGALAEGLFEETPQSMQEQAWQNYADGKPLGDGVVEQGVIGGIQGGLMGGAFGAGQRPSPRPQVMVDPQTGEAKPVPSAGNGPISGAVNAGVENGAIPSVPKPTPTITAQEVTARAQAKLDALNLAANGTPDTQTVDDAGNAVTVPGERPRILADNEKALRTFLTENIGNPDALASFIGMTIQPEAGSLADAANAIPRPRTPDMFTRMLAEREADAAKRAQVGAVPDVVEPETTPRTSRWMNDAGVPRAPTHEEAVDYLRQKLLDNGFAQTRQVRKKDIRALVDADGETMVARTFNPALDEAARSLARELNAASDAQATAPRQPTTEPQNGGRSIEPGSTTSEGLPTDGQANPLESSRAASANHVVADAAAQPAVVPVVGDQAQVSTATDANPAAPPESRASAASQAASLQPLPQEAATAPTDSAEIGSKSVANQAAPRAETAVPSTTTTQKPTPKTGVGGTPTATGATAQPQSAVAPTTTIRAGVRRYSPTAQTAQAYYQPGRVVPSYYGQDRVLAFRPEADGKPWAVQVQAVDKAGNPTGEPRWHATFPEKKELNAVLGAASQYSPKALKDRAASLAQGASTPANESQPVAQMVEIEDGQAQPAPKPASRVGSVVHTKFYGQDVSPSDLVKTKDVYGKTVYVHKDALADESSRLLPMYVSSGKPNRKAGRHQTIHRENLDPTGEKKRARDAKHGGGPKIIGRDTDNGTVAFKTEAAAKTYATKNGHADTHDVVPASRVGNNAGGFVLLRKDVSTNAGNVNTSGEARSESAGNDAGQIGAVHADSGETPEAVTPAASGGIDEAAVRAAYNAAMQAKTGVTNFDYGKGTFGDLIVGALNRDPEIVESARSSLINGSNETGLRVFFQQAGMKMPRTQREQRAAFDAYIGVTPEQRAASDKARQDAKQAKREQEITARRDRKPIPDFKDAREADAWWRKRAEAFPSQGAYRATPEYSEFLEKTKGLYAKSKEDFTASRNDAMKAAGIAAGDRVRTSQVGAFLSVNTFTGTVVMRGGVPWVKLDAKVPTSRKGRSTMASMVRWSSEWKKDEERGPELGRGEGQKDPGELLDRAVVEDASGNRYVVQYARHWRVRAISMDVVRDVEFHPSNAQTFNLRPGDTLEPNEVRGPLYDTGLVYDLATKETRPAPTATHQTGQQAEVAVTPAVVEKSAKQAASKVTMAQARADLLKQVDAAIAQARKAYPFTGEKDSKHEADIAWWPASQSGGKVTDAEIAGERKNRWESRSVVEARVRMDRVAENRRRLTDQYGYTTFEVKGDGTFKVLNFGPRLLEFRKEIERRFKERPGGAVAKIPGYEPAAKLTASEAERAKIMAEAETVDDAAPEQPAPAIIEHNGTRIYQARIRSGDEVVTRFAVESADNKARREAGERTIGGDSLHATLEAAKNAADMERKQKEQKEASDAAQKAESDAKAQADAARKADDLNGFTATMSAMQAGKVKAALDKQVRFDGVVMTLRERVESLHSAGTLSVETFEEPAIKPMTRTQYNRATQREQDAHEAKMKAAGNKTVYLVNEYDIGKTAYDYAQYLLATKLAPSQQQAGRNGVMLAKATKATKQQIAEREESTTGTLDGQMEAAPAEVLHTAAMGAIQVGDDDLSAASRRASRDWLAKLRSAVNQARYATDMADEARYNLLTSSGDLIAGVLRDEATYGKAEIDRAIKSIRGHAKQAGIESMTDALAATKPAPSKQQADLKGFKREDRSGGAFDLVDGNMRVRVEPTENGKYQAHFGSARSSPHLQGIEGAVAWAATYRDDGSKPSKPQSKPAPSADRGEVLESVEDVPEGQELVALHNLDESNLLFADKLGGIPVPSIGITKASTPFDGFGSISLIGRTGLATPGSDNPVFSSDAYTTRFPDLVWDKVPTKRAEEFMASFGEPYGERDLQNTWDYLVNRPDRDRAINEAVRGRTLMKAWLKEQGEVPVAPVMEKNEPSSVVAWAAMDSFIAKAREIIAADGRNLRPDDSQWKDLSAAALVAVKEKIEADVQEAGEDMDKSSIRIYRKMITDSYMSNAFDEDGMLYFARGDRALAYVANMDAEPRQDNYATSLALQNQIGERKPEFEAWVAEKINSLFAAPSIKLGGRKVPMNLENVVEAMASRKVRGREKSITFGAGQVAAANSKQFKSLAEIKKSRDSIVSEEEHRAAKDGTEKLLEAYRNLALPYYTITNYRGEVDTWNGLDDSMRALAAAAKKAPTIAAIRSGLARNNFDVSAMDPEVFEAGVEALKAVRQTVVDYFEAKPQRAVQLSEFAGAVIPTKTSEAARSLLAKAGVRVMEYDGTPSSRRDAIAKLSRDLHAESGDVLFQQEAQDVDPAELTPAERAAFDRQSIDRKGLRAKLSREQGAADADAMGLREAVQAALGKAGVDVVYLRGMDGLPPDMLADVERKAKERGSAMRTAGLFNPVTKEVLVFTDVARTPQMAAFTASHEIAGHLGLRALLGDLLDAVLDLAVQNPTVKAVADHIYTSRKMYKDVQSGKKTERQQRLLSVEEALADLAAANRTSNWQRIQDKHGVKVPPSMRSRVAAMLQNVLRRIKALFGKQGVAFTDAQVLNLLENAWQAAQGDSAIGTPTSALESAENAGMAEDDYRGEHEAPTKGSGAPGHDVTGGGNFYPDDVYGPNGLRYYGTGEPAMDAEAYGHIRRLKNHPNYQITVYRAVPKSVKGGIKAGDWVTTVRRYALDHGRGVLNGDYKIQSKIVRANEIFTNGDSWLEWGYDPQPFDMDAHRAARERRAEKQRQNDALESTEGGSLEGMDLSQTKVVGKDGNPLTVFHGSTSAIEGDYRIPAFFSESREGAEWFAQGGGKVNTAKLDIRNPLDVSTQSGAFKFVQLARKAGVEIESDIADNGKPWDFQAPEIAKHSPYDGTNVADLIYIPKVRKALEAAGFDGLKAADPLENGDHDVWVALRADQIQQQPLESTEDQTQSEADNQSILRSRSVRAEQTPADAGVSRSGLSMQEGQRLKRELTAHWGRDAPRVVLVESAEELRDIARQQGVDPTEIDERVEGLYLGKPTVWLNLSAIRTPTRFREVLTHEALGHYGVEQVVGEQEWAAITDAVNRHVDNKTGAKDVQAAIAQLRRTQAGIFTIKDAALRRQTIAKEVIAVMTENGSRNGLVMRVIAAVRRFLRKLMPGMAWRDADIRDLILQAHGFMREGRSNAFTDAGVVKPFTNDTGAYSQAAPNFYSAMLEAVVAGKGAPKKADAAGWKGWLDGAVRRGEFKQAERDWLGVDAWLDGRENTTRAEIADFIRANEVQVQDVVLGDNDAVEAEVEAWWNDEGGANEETPYGELSPSEQREARERYMDEVAEYAEGGPATKFADYQLPGGKNYRELLLTLPDTQKIGANGLPEGYELRSKIIDAGIRGLERTTYYVVNASGERVTLNQDSPEGALAVLKREDQRSDQFKSSHFDQPNILAHVRFNERTDADGKRVLFLEEVQSDWHQAGRKKGYASGNERSIADIDAELSKVQRERSALIDAAAALPDSQMAEFNRMTSQIRQMADRMSELNREWDAAMKADKAVPDAPFKGTDEWAMLAFKRMVRHAAENGFDRIAWTTGEQQAERYDLSKQVSQIRVIPGARNTSVPVGMRRVIITKSDGADIDLKVGGDGTVSAGPFNAGFNGKSLDDVVGKEIAERIMAAEKETALRGDGLRVGGSGMRGFYDKILPSAVNKWAKKFGGKVGQARLGGGAASYESLVDAAQRTGRTQAELDAMPVAERKALVDAQLPHVHSLDLTPQMRDAALQGLPLFSRAPAEELASIEADMRAVAAAADGGDGVVARIKQWLKDATPKELKDRLRGTWLGALTTRMLTTLGQDYFPTMRLYTDFLAEMQASRNEMQQEGEDVAETVRKWAGKNRQDAERLFDTMHEATIAGVDPAEAYQPLTFKAGKQWIEVNKQNVKDRIAVLRDQMLGRGGDSKQDMMNEVKALRAMLKAEPHRKAKYPALVAKWNQLSPEAQQHYRTMRELYSKRHDATEAALIQRINDLKMDGGENRKRVLIDVIRQQFEAQRRQGVYFPLQRFGQYFVAAEKNGVSAFQMYGSLPELKRAVAAMRARDYTITAQGLKSAGKAKDAPSGTFVAEVIEAMDKAHVSEQVQDEIYQMYLQALPELSMRKHKIHRKSVPGWDTDALRAFSFNMLHGAHQIARLQYAHKLSDTIDVLQAQQDAARKAPDADTARITAGDHILEELRRRHEWIMNPQDSNLTNLITSAGFTYYLGVTPAAALVNLTQVPMITLPYLGSRFGHAAASKALFAAMKASARTGGHIQRTLTSQEEIDAHKELQRSGALDKTQVHNLAGIAEGGMAGFNPKWAKAMAIIGLPFHKAEVINREATGMAAFRLARAEGKSFDEAVKFAADAIHETQFDYSNQNRARYMQSGPAKVLLMFRQYSQNLTWHIARMVFEATKHADPDVRRIARRNLAGVLGMSALFSGTLGLPLMSVTMGILNAIAASFGDDDEPWDAETEFRAFLNDMLGKTGANVVLHGAANAVTGADIASRVSYSDLWFRDADRELDGRGQYYNLLEQAAGPMGGVLKNVLVGKQMIDEGHVMRGVETMMPKAIKDAIKAVRYADEGVNNLRGDPIVASPGAASVAAQLIGFTPAEVSERYAENRSLKNYEQYVIDRRRSLMDGLAMAIRLGDADARAEAMGKIRAFNRAWPQIALTPDSIRRSMRARAKYDRQAENGIMLNRKIAGRVRDAVGVE